MHDSACFFFDPVTSDLPVPVAPTTVTRGLSGAGAMVHEVNARMRRSMQASKKIVDGRGCGVEPKMLVRADGGGCALPC